MNSPESCAITWRSSSYSGNGGDCIEVGWAGTGVRVRDTKDRAGGTLSINESAWSALLRTQRES